MELKPTTEQRLRERIILVTGASEGIGRAVACACAAEGATVILSGMEERDLEPVYDLIESSGAPQPAILPLNLEEATEDDYVAAANVIGDAFGRLDGLALCSSYMPYLGRIYDFEVSEWQRVIQFNLTAPFMLIQACLPLLQESADASVVLTSDRVGRNGLAYWGPFAAAKAGLEKLMEVLSAETEQDENFRVNTVDPGVVRTAMRHSLYPGEIAEDNPLPETITPLYVRLLGPEGRGIRARALNAQPDTSTH